jgi:hypothetical protein
MSYSRDPAPVSSSGGTGVSVEATLVKNKSNKKEAVNNFSGRSSISRFVPQQSFEEDESIEMMNNFLHNQTNEELLSNELLSTQKKDKDMTTRSA